jgi:hypothetical protein
LKFADVQAKQLECLTQILDFVSKSPGLHRRASATGELEVEQAIDGKSILIAPEKIEEVLLRSDVEGRDFIQINFVGGVKILMTESLIGFKPLQLAGLDLSKLPKVVTTPDVNSVFDAIQEALHLGDENSDEVFVLKKVFDAVVAGGEAVGFNLTAEKAWISRVPAQSFKANA